MKKPLAILIVLLMLIALFPTTAFAAALLISTDGTHDISGYGSITISGGVTVTLTNSGGATLTNVTIECIGPNTTLTLNGVKIDNSANANTCALSFMGAGNTLSLVGDSVLTSGEYEPGIRVEEGTSLVIQGSGSVSATGGIMAAGIGSGRDSDCGVVRIRSGSVTARGSSYGAGIGSGSSGEACSIRIDGGSVQAVGGMHGAGIGTGGCRDEGKADILISGGSVTAQGGSNAAGIGGGVWTNCGITQISGGYVVAIGGYNAAGIGNGKDGAGGTVGITGGSVFAYGVNLGWDIGSAENAPINSVTISGDAGVFLRNNKIDALTTTHTHMGVQSKVSGRICGINAPSGWWSAGAYIVPCTLTYNANGADGSAPGSVTVQKGGTAIAATNSGMTNGRLAMVQWNTSPNCEGYGYYPGVDIRLTEDTTVYAIWRDRDVTSVTLDAHTLDLTHHGDATLAATVDPVNSTKNDVVWYSMDTDVAVVDQSGAVTAVGVGSSTVVAWADGVRDTCAVTVTKKSVSDVMLSESEKTLDIGENAALSATVSPNDATDGAVTWTSSDASVATVNESGVVLAVDVGSATITATADGEYAECDVTVQQPVTSVELSREVKTLTVGGSITLAAVVSPADAANATVTWTSQDESIATVDENGIVMAVSDGLTSIIAEADGKYDVCVVSVNRADTTVTLSASAKELTVGDTVTLTATASPYGTEINWISKDENIAIVDESGTVTAVSEGLTSILAEADGKYDVCVVSVNRADTTVVLSSSAQTITVGDTITLTATASPHGTKVNWTSKDENIATVDESGTVTAVSEGVTSIIAEAEGVYDICTVAVNRADITVVLSSSAETLSVGDTVTLLATVASPGTENSVVWRSMDTVVATVDQTGVVSAKSAGTAVIIAEADGAYGVCGISVIKKESRETEPVPTASPAPSTAPSAAPGNDNSGDETDESSPIESATADAAEIPDTNDNTVTPQKVEESSGDPEVVIVTIKVSDLPSGTSSVRTAGGEEIIISGDDTVKMEVGRDELGADGALEIVALDAEGTPLAAVDVQIEPDRSAEAPVQAGLAGLLWVFIGLVVGIGIGFGAFMLRNKKR